jgi:hypothetical protein
LSSERNAPFYFYLDPNAGKRLNIETKKILFWKTRKFVLSEMPEDNYKLKFGVWQYYTEGYRLKSKSSHDLSIEDSLLPRGLMVIGESGKPEELPAEILNIGRFMASRYLHREAFRNTHDFFDNDGQSFAAKHSELIDELRIHLKGILDFVFK